jgi:hypothetical protein
MKRFAGRFLFTIILTASIPCAAQKRVLNFSQLHQLDSIAKSPSIAGHFGSLYVDFLSRVEPILATTDSTTQYLIRKFEIVLACFYISACDSFRINGKVNDPEFAAYFSDTTLSPLQYKLLGANAHLNSELAEAIMKSFSKEEWNAVKLQYPLFNRCLKETYASLYHQSLKENRKLRLIRVITLGLDKRIGYVMLNKWRRGQMRLAVSYFADSGKYTRIHRKNLRRKHRIDSMVIRYL